ncbi:MAG TPA: TetR/AcrR family transcriptional regulator [Symbiobacteriaceae bacterium]|nr:TetR/AcrR family transcriptional regulator [Symbiobacteriaceae bacterium]
MSKGEQTQERIVERALQLATRDGLAGLTINRLAVELGLSKSGLFAHFGSKEELQLQVLRAAAQQFQESVVRPALTAPRGEPRVRALLEHWLAWANDSTWPGGCIFVASAVELDDRPGPLREYLVSTQEAFLATLAKVARQAMEVSHFRSDLDPEQFGFDLYAIVLGYHHAKRLLHDVRAEERARNAFDRLIQSART